MTDSHSMMETAIDRRQSIVPPANNVPYLIVIVVMMLSAVGFVLGISYLRPEADNAQLITTMVGFIATTTASMLAYMKSQETHLSVNSRLDAFMANAKLAARAEGVNEGRQEGRESANARTDALAEGQTQRPVPVEVTNVDPIPVRTEPKE